jgi:hypothetical protein
MNTFLDQISVDHLIAFGFKPGPQQSPKRERAVKNRQRRQEKRNPVKTAKVNKTKSAA